MRKENPYDQRYANQEYYWERKPSVICDRIIEIIQPSSDFHPKLLALGSGEGSNAAYFAKHGIEVVGLDLSLPGLEKTRSYAEEDGVHVKTIHADIVSYELEDVYDVIFSTGTLQYLPPEVRAKHFQDYKEHTSHKGIIAFSAFVRKPFIPGAPDAEETAFLYKSGELMDYFWDREIIYCTEEIFDCMSNGVPHKHAVNRIRARRYHNGV